MRNFGFVGLIFFILSVNTSLCQSRYWIATSASNWNNTANWSATSGGTGGASVPGSANAVIFDANGLGNCSLDMAPTISSITINGYTGTIDLSGNSFTITSTSALTFTTGTITNTGASASLTFTTTSSTTFNGTTVSVNISGTSGTLTFSGGSTFNGTVSMSAATLLLNGTSSSRNTFNGTTTLTKTGSTTDNGFGGNVFNGVTTLVNSGSGWFESATVTADTFNGDVTLTNSGSSIISMASSTSGNAFNGNILVNSTGSTTGTGIRFANNTSTGAATLASGKTIKVGSTGFSIGTLTLQKFTQSGTTSQALTLTGTATLALGLSSIFNGAVTFISPRILLNGATYNGTTYIEQNGNTGNSGDGGNTFNGTTTIVNSGSGYLTSANSSPDTFNGVLTLTNSGSNGLYIADKAAGNIFNNNIIVNSTAGNGVFFCNNSPATATLASGKTITVGTSFTAGTLGLIRFTQLGSTAQTLTLTSTATLTIGPSSTFNGSVTFKAPFVFLNGCTYNGSTYIEKTGGTQSQGNGGNTFNATTTLVNSGSGYLATGYVSADIFNADVTATNTGSGWVALSDGAVGTQFNGNIILNSTSTTSSYSNTSGPGITFGNNPGTTTTGTLATGKTISVGSTGFTGGRLLFRRFTQSGSTPQSFTLTGTARLELGNSSTFNAAVTFKAPQLMLNGCTYNGTTYLEKTGATDNAGNGSNVFNGTTTLANSGSGYISSAFATLDTFNGQLTLTNTGSNAIYMAHKVPGTVFNGNVIVNSTAGIGINFCNNSAATASLASGKTITVGGSGFTAGTLTLQRFTQVGSTSQSLTLTGTSILTLGPSSTFNGDVIFKSPQLLLNGCTYNGVTYLEKTGATDNDSNGSNIFNSTTTLANSGSGYLLSANTTLDTFNGQLTLTNTGSNAIYMAHNVSGTVFNGNIIVNSTAGTGIYFCRNSTGAASLASGKTITIGGSGFTSGLLALQRFTQVGSTPQSLTLTGTATLHIGPSSTFGGNVTFISPQVYLNGCTFNGITSIEKNGATNNLSTGGNTFAGTTTLTNSSTAIWYLAGTTADIFNSSVVFIQSSTGSLLPAYMGTNYFYGDVTISSSSVITFGSSGTGIVQLDGGTDQTITSASSIPVIQQLIVNKSSTTNTVTLSSPVSISTSATLTSGIINTTSTNYLNFADNATVTGASNSSYVNGPVRKTGNDAFVFPVGASNLYRAITMSAPSLTTDKFTAQYFYSAQPYGGSSTWDPSLYNISQCDYWILDRTTGTSSVTVRLSWDDSSCPGGTGYINSPSDLRVARFNSATSTWVNEGNGGTTGTTSIGTVISGAAVTSFSPFAIATVSSTNPLPIELRFFKASAERNSKVILTWETAAEKNNDFFTIERSGDGETFESIKKIDGAGNSSLPIDYASMDNAPLRGLSYYRLKQTDFDGHFSYSRIVAVQIDASSIFYLYPNPSVGGEFFIQLSEQNVGSSKITISDTQGVIVYNKSVEVSNGLIHVEKIENLSSGFYRVCVESNDGIHTYKLIVN